jgi:hypothetical protein
MIRSADPQDKPIDTPQCIAAHPDDLAYGPKLVKAIRKVCATKPIADTISFETFQQIWSRQMRMPRNITLNMVVRCITP